MVWTAVQRERLAIEKVTLEKYFKLGVTWIDPRHETKVDVVLKSNSDKDYTLRVYIPADFPNACPILVVVKPETLLLKNGKRLPEGNSEFHTFVDHDGFHRICHFFPSQWTPELTLYQVFMKGLCFPCSPYVDKIQLKKQQGQHLRQTLLIANNIS